MAELYREIYDAFTLAVNQCTCMYSKWMTWMTGELILCGEIFYICITLSVNQCTFMFKMDDMDNGGVDIVWRNLLYMPHTFSNSMYMYVPKAIHGFIK